LSYLSNAFNYPDTHTIGEKDTMQDTEATQEAHAEVQQDEKQRIVPIEEEAREDAVHVNLGWRSWVRNAKKTGTTRCLHPAGRHIRDLLCVGISTRAIVSFDAKLFSIMSQVFVVVAAG
jgi:hypothetical protein